MFREFSNHQDAEKSAEIYIRLYYSTGQADIDLATSEAKHHEAPGLSMVNYLMNKANHEAEFTGLAHNPRYPQNYLPTMLAAVKELEEGIPAETKHLTLPLYIELLALGESTTAQKLIKKGSFDEAYEHTNKTIKLLDFHSVLV